MRVLMIGAGSVGVVLTRFLENTKGNDVTYCVREGRKAKLQRTRLLDARTGELHVRERPQVIEVGSPLPIVDLAVLAVRSDQLDGALDLVARLQGEPRIATASAGFDDLARVRQRFGGRPSVQILPLFMAYPEGDVIKWSNPPLARTLITDEHDDPSQALAEELAQALSQGGLPARALRSFAGARDLTFGAGMALLAGFELAGWDLGALAGDPELRALASRGVREGLRAMVKSPLAGRLIGFAPAPLVSAALRVAPRLTPTGVQEMWRVHGPKIAAQTRALLDLVIARGEAHQAGTDGLRELRRRLGGAP